MLNWDTGQGSGEAGVSGPPAGGVTWGDVVRSLVITLVLLLAIPIVVTVAVIVFCIVVVSTSP